MPHSKSLVLNLYLFEKLSTCLLPLTAGSFQSSRSCKWTPGAWAEINIFRWTMLPLPCDFSWFGFFRNNPLQIQSVLFKILSGPIAHDQQVYQIFTSKPFCKESTISFFAWRSTIPKCIFPDMFAKTLKFAKPVVKLWFLLQAGFNTNRLKAQSSMISAVACSSTPKITVVIGGCHGPESYAMVAMFIMNPLYVFYTLNTVNINCIL